ncbi:MAG: hypothetical protein JWM78_165 [Verrucomicrobiaceae bacterium]|nr:hypothetical protein [Verrucomicrobiaceae bacterium]
MPHRSLFYGAAVFIDDHFHAGDPRVTSIKEQIEQAGCHVVGMTGLPKENSWENLKFASFFIVDWKLHEGSFTDEGGVPMARASEQLDAQHVAETIEFLKKLKEIRFAPVFIFTNEDVESVQEHIKKCPELNGESGPSHIFVKNKSEVLERGVFDVLSDWLKTAPSAYVLKRWEQEYERAKNALFLDFYNKSVYWPLIMWKTFEQDSVPQSIELGNLIGRNLASRMTPFDFDLGSYVDAFDAHMPVNQNEYRAMLQKVLSGERFLDIKYLHESSVSPGDIFYDGKKYYYINVRPECDCFPRGEVQLDDLPIYLLRGAKLSHTKTIEKYDKAYGSLRESDNEAVLFGLLPDTTISFRFSDLKIEVWKDWKEKRIGRLLPPFLTRLQLRYSAYLQRPGLPRVPPEAIKPIEENQQATQ